MSRLRKKSTVLEAARARLAALKAMKPAPNFGPTLAVEGYEAKIQSFAVQLDGYNQLLAELDEKLNDLLRDQAELHDWNLRIRAAVVALRGRDSSEYEMVGGVRSSERKRRKRKPKPSE